MGIRPSSGGAAEETVSPQGARRSTDKKRRRTL